MSWAGLELDPIGPLWAEVGLTGIILALWVFSTLSTRAQPLQVRISVSILRLLILSFTWLLVHNPTLVRTLSKESEQRIAIMVDRSGSMGVGSSQAGSRFESARNMVTKIQEAWPQAEIYEFDQDIYGPRNSLSGTNELTGKRTDFYQSLNQLLNKQPDLSGVVLLSDGHDLGRYTNLTLDETQSWLDRLNAPPFQTVLLGDKGSGPEIAIHSVEAPGFSYVRAPVTIRATVLVEQLPAQARQVQLLEGQNIIQVKDLILDNQGFGTVQFEFYPEQIGEHLYTIHVPPHATEANTINNTQNVLIDVGRDKISVLHISGSITWDLQGMRGLFELNPLVDLTAFFIMRTREHLQIGTDGRNISPDEMALVPFPTEEIFDRQLFGFDVIVFQDFDAGNYFNDSYQASRLLNKIRTFIREHHGGFIVLGGPQMATGPSLGTTPLADVLALKPPSYRVPYDLETVEAKPTILGKNHPILETFQPETHLFHGSMDQLVAHPKANLLLQDKDKKPLLSTLEMETGRTIFLNTSSSWKWYRSELEQGLTGSGYQKFWENMLKWVIHDPSLNQVRMTTYRSLDRPLDLDIEILLRKSNYQPGANQQTRVVIQSVDNPDNIVEAPVSTNSEGKAQVKLKVGQPGYYQLLLPDSPWAELSKPQIVFLGGSQDEFGNQDPVPQNLSKLANLTGGHFQNQNQFDPSKWSWRERNREEILETSRLKIRNWVWGLPILLLLTGTEWFLRRTRYLA